MSSIYIVSVTVHFICNNIHYNEYFLFVFTHVNMHAVTQFNNVVITMWDRAYYLSRSLP